MSPAEREASAASWFEFQDARDGAGQLAALKEGGRNRERLQRGEVTDAELEQELDDDIAAIGVVEDASWYALTPNQRHAALTAALGFDPHPGHNPRT